MNLSELHDLIISPMSDDINQDLNCSERHSDQAEHRLKLYCVTVSLPERGAETELKVMVVVCLYERARTRVCVRVCVFGFICSPIIHLKLKERRWIPLKWWSAGFFGSTAGPKCTLLWCCWHLFPVNFSHFTCSQLAKDTNSNWTTNTQIPPELRLHKTLFPSDLNACCLTASVL